ncbi:PP2C family protein-serine/threonine phosphatase [Geodermatophilus maliterrae]|uniref:PP2C family protein-serine/threonine phosphatase n=1 Tax=Geodermatophilus maliterrae TaxID=3162531 RepID=A0ABV3XCW6_9ACTN
MRDAGASADLVRQARGLQALFDGDAVGMAAGTGEVIEQANDELLRILGLGRADLDGGIRWPAITPPDQTERDAGAVDAVRRSGSILFQKDFLRPDGSRVPVLAAVAALRWDPYEWVAVVIDLSRQERLRHLAQSEAAIVSTLLRDAPIGFALIDLEMRFVRINQELAAMNGLSVAEHEGRPVFDVVPDLRADAEPLLRRVLDTGEPLRDVEIVGATPADPGTARTWIESFFPVRTAGGPTIGVAAVARDVTEVRRLEQELRATLGRQRQVLQDLQNSLLPPLPTIPGLDLAARYLGASQEIRLGGDWFDVFHAPDGRLVLAIGDVVGHGPTAVGLMARLSGAMRAHVADGRSPGQVLACLNQLLIGSLAPAMATASVLHLDLTTGVVEYAAAGHPYGLLQTPEGPVTLLNGAQGRALGATADSTYPVGRTTLEVGGTLLLYTDGLVERRGEDLDQGVDRLVAVVAHGRAGGAARLVRDVIEGSHTAVERDDDVCVLAAVRA